MGLAVIPGSRAISILFILSLNQIKRGILIEKFNFILAPHSCLSVSVWAVAYGSSQGETAFGGWRRTDRLNP